MKNKRGQSVGLFLAIAVGILVGLVLLQAAAPFVGLTSTTYTTRNTTTFTIPAAGSCVDLVGQEVITSYGVYNTTNNIQIGTGNYTLKGGISTTDGLKRVRYCTKVADLYTGSKGNASYVYAPEGYAEDAGSRSVISLILIFGAIAIALFALYPTLKERFD